MPRARSPDSIEAEKLYKSGMALVDIAKKLGKPEGTVRRWKSTQKWDENGKKNKASVRKRKVDQKKRAFVNEADSPETRIARESRTLKGMEPRREHRTP